MSSSVTVRHETPLADAFLGEPSAPIPGFHPGGGFGDDLAAVEHGVQSSRSPVAGIRYGDVPRTGYRGPISGDLTRTVCHEEKETATAKRLAGLLRLIAAAVGA